MYTHRTQRQRNPAGFIGNISSSTRRWAHVAFIKNDEVWIGSRGIILHYCSHIINLTCRSIIKTPSDSRYLVSKLVYRVVCPFLIQDILGWAAANKRNALQMHHPWREKAINSGVVEERDGKLNYWWDVSVGVDHVDGDGVTQKDKARHAGCMSTCSARPRTSNQHRVIRCCTWSCRFGPKMGTGIS
jgi:hypothetical protein